MNGYANYTVPNATMTIAQALNNFYNLIDQSKLSPYTTRLRYGTSLYHLSASGGSSRILRFFTVSTTSGSSSLIALSLSNDSTAYSYISRSTGFTIDDLGSSVAGSGTKLVLHY